MGVRVHLKTGRSYSEDAAKAFHWDGDGYLDLRDEQRGVIAVFAPNTWEMVIPYETNTEDA